MQAMTVFSKIYLSYLLRKSQTNLDPPIRVIAEIFHVYIFLNHCESSHYIINDVMIKPSLYQVFL